ncbi:MAG: hypothetical protein ACEY3L_16445 [Wolbachia sp.]|uniref:hypothetical protein n=1 Tax=Wolbachia endosymbiont (group A) of Tiphia femorata TaxID=2954063 RepID=UPI002230AF77|nr:hypothetical protein [Wolbachia endosymbiont (group A) of Tiphia femorata]
MHECCNYKSVSTRRVSSQCVTLGWLCCIATYERLTIVRIISNLLKILFFCNQSDQI